MLATLHAHLINQAINEQAINISSKINQRKALDCPNESGPVFALELASLMELNYGQESQTRRDYCEVTSS